MQLSNEIRLTGLLSDGHGTRAQAHDLDLPDCELCGHPIPNGQEYVLMKFLRGERYPICFTCANQHCSSTRSWFPRNEKYDYLGRSWG